jgi:general secretion pathway protein G
MVSTALNIGGVPIDEPSSGATICPIPNPQTNRSNSKNSMKINRILPANRTAGFTLMELMLVLGIITLLIVAGMRVAPMITKSGRETAARADVGNLAAALLMYQNKHGGRLPGSLDKLVAAGDIQESQLLDPWGNKYVLVIPNKRSKQDKFDLYSVGNDGLDSTGDDVGNFESP